MNHHYCRIAVLKALSIGLGISVSFTSVSGQTQTNSSTPPVLAKAEAKTTLIYRSVFAEYQRFSEDPVASWSDANKTVGKIGGWRAYARESRQQEPAENSGAIPTIVPVPAPVPVPKPAPGMPGKAHDGHGSKQ